MDTVTRLISAQAKVEAKAVAVERLTWARARMARRALLHQHLGLKEVRIQAREPMDQPKEVGKAVGLAGYAMDPICSELAQKEDKEVEAKEADIQARLLNSMVMAKAA